MSYNKQILEKMKDELESKLRQTKKEMDNDPTSILIKKHLSFHDWLKKTQGTNTRTSQESIKFIKKLDSEIKEQEKRKKSWSWGELSNQYTELNSELADVMSQLYYFENRS